MSSADAAGANGSPPPVILSEGSPVVKLGCGGGTAASTSAGIRCTKPTVAGSAGEWTVAGKERESRPAARPVGNLGVGPTPL